MDPNRYEVFDDKVMVGFFGVPGTSKSSIADHISRCFRLGILRTDSIRFEVKEDLRVQSLSVKEDLQFSSINQNGALAEYEGRLQERMDDTLGLGRPFILDGSMDRRWQAVSAQLQASGYDWFMVNMELSEGFLKDLYSGTGRESFLPQLPAYIADHQKFLERYHEDVAIEVTDEVFSDRLKFAADSLHSYILARNNISEAA